mmetsp:Transcript_7579/g.24255  ORF Transcript_7579/g.24255 Transcript_7579/m.24255 type:complete len:244 (+) Transcript_7579:78-809(+)
MSGPAESLTPALSRGEVAASRCCSRSLGRRCFLPLVLPPADARRRFLLHAITTSRQHTRSNNTEPPSRRATSRSDSAGQPDPSDEHPTTRCRTVPGSPSGGGERDATGVAMGAESHELSDDVHAPTAMATSCSAGDRHTEAAPPKVPASACTFSQGRHPWPSTDTATHTSHVGPPNVSTAGSLGIGSAGAPMLHGEMSVRPSVSRRTVHPCTTSVPPSISSCPTLTLHSSPSSHPTAPSAPRK